MLGTNCLDCGSQFLSTSIYHERKKLTVGLFCPQCLKIVRYNEDFNKFRDKIISENQEKSKLKPKFIKKQRKLCPYCQDKGKENRTKWTIRKIPKKKDETQSWKCTCQICGGVWTTNSGDEYWYYPEGYNKSHEQLRI